MTAALNYEYYSEALVDFGTTLRQIIPIFIPLVALMIPLLAIGIGGWAKVQRNREIHETIRQIMARGQEVPPPLLEVLHAERPAEPRSSSWTPIANLRGGLINVGVGAGLIVFLYAMRPDGWLWAVGAIPLCLGLALLLAWRIERAEVVPRALDGLSSSVGHR
jgi:hypothetical protein